MPTSGVHPPELPHSVPDEHRQKVTPATNALHTPYPMSAPAAFTRVAQQLADAGHSELVSHRCAHERLPLRSAKHTDPALQHTAPHALASEQHAPATHVWPEGHAPAGFARLHGDDGMRQAPPLHVCPLGHVPVGFEGPHGDDGVTHAPAEQVCPLGQTPEGLKALHEAGCGEPHVYVEHVCPTAHVRPQAPQLRVSSRRLTHPPPHRLKPEPQPTPGVVSGPHAASDASSAHPIKTTQKRLI